MNELIIMSILFFFAMLFGVTIALWSFKFLTNIFWNKWSRFPDKVPSFKKNLVVYTKAKEVYLIAPNGSDFETAKKVYKSYMHQKKVAFWQEVELPNYFQLRSIKHDRDNDI